MFKTIYNRVTSVVRQEILIDARSGAQASQAASRWVPKLLALAAIMPLVPLGAVGVGIPLFADSSPASAGTSQCLIINSATDSSFSSLSAAEGAASPGATLWVRGHCTGTTSITKSLTLVGQHPKGFLAPTLYGNNGGSVLNVEGRVALVLDSLTITGGKGDFNGDLFALVGGGIDNFLGTVSLNSGTNISDNTAVGGGGIWNQNGTVNLNGGTVSGNAATGNGGGIFNFGIGFGTATVNLNSGAISDNTALGGGGIVNSENFFGTSTVNLNGGSISGNTATLGGGIGNFEGTLSNDKTTMSDNTPQDVCPAYNSYTSTGC
jgi:hypothetical protein